MSQELLTPTMRSLLGRIARARRRSLHEMTPVEARALYEAGAEVLDLPRCSLPVVVDFELPRGDGGTNRARYYAVADGSRPLVLFLHGGGFVMGSLETHDSLCRQIALRSGWGVVALEYRLAPEHRFPAAVEDAWAAAQTLDRWLRGAPASEVPPGLVGVIGVAARGQGDPGRKQLLAVAGDSAGATLAAVVTHLARDAGLPLALQVLITPGTAAEPDSDSHRRFANGFLLDAKDLVWMCDHTIAPADRHDWRFAPILAEPRDVAPAFVMLAECDPLVDEGQAYMERLRAAEVPVALMQVPGVTHDFIKLGRVLRAESELALSAVAGALRAVCDPLV